jgi:hypothetical protein
VLRRGGGVMGEILKLPRLAKEQPLIEPPACGAWAELALSVARIGARPLRTEADLQEAIMVLRLANARTKELTGLAENQGLKDQVSTKTTQVDQLLDELLGRTSTGS